MQPTFNDARPPYVTFERKAVEDREASLKEGMPRFKDIDYAIITPAGSKDRIERVVGDWFETLPKEVQGGRFPQSWLDAYKATYGAWKEGRELPEHGQAITNWPVASPAQMKQLLDLKVRTVEALAEANEETLMRIGMGGRALKQQAQDYLKAANGTGKLVGQLNAAREEVETLRASQVKLLASVAELQAQLKALAPVSA